ncbi:MULTISPECIES: helix-turn-helix transcriptional regulator [unclassified Crossiella]|uniref:helix-turn-helix domain-containing protein n=1 Tax=unclassified Crossiella TaxID=2620835 RepID=UPI001FFEB186|nr:MULTISPECIES: helix-turn-helix transcriptional regulator [unclassified Crossiella]MCK2242179.1 helix-turn-helix transcriptional regulator [Crossiella sp. S99.2]MCK2256082.1 helix-turn-helix transcriptional regulator [Crossiella sp. S99.1]
MSTPHRGRGLTEPQIAVLRLVAEGLTNAEIAARLHIALDTVKSRLFTIMKRLGVRTRAAAVLHALHLGLLGVATVRLDGPGVIDQQGQAYFHNIVCDPARAPRPIRAATGEWISTVEALTRAAALFSAVHYAQGGRL